MKAVHMLLQDDVNRCHPSGLRIYCVDLRSPVLPMSVAKLRFGCGGKREDERTQDVGQSVVKPDTGKCRMLCQISFPSLFFSYCPL
jgi:hypothetical protein